jgi:hypothetical protein
VYVFMYVFMYVCVYVLVGMRIVGAYKKLFRSILWVVQD